MNVAIVGSSGYIAKYIIQRFEQESNIEEILRIGHTRGTGLQLDLSEPERFEYDRLDNMDFVVFTAAISQPDKCAEDYKYCWSVNVTGTNYFIQKAIKKGCKVLFFSSDAVFGDTVGRIYTEHSKLDARTPYGCMKKAVEEQFEKERDFKAIRLPYVVSAEDRFVSYCLSCIQKKEPANIFHPFYRNCITVKDVVQVVCWFVGHWEEYPATVLNVAGKELISRVRIADELNRFLGDSLEYEVSFPGNVFFQNRPKITQMQSLYLQKYHILDEESFTEKFKKELEVVKNVY